MIDRLLGLPMILGLNLLTRVLGRILRLNHRFDPAEVRVVVVAKFFGLGSILQSTPMLRALRRRFPRARVVFVTSRSNAGLIERLAEVDAGVYVDDRTPAALVASTARAVLALIRLRPQWYLDLEVYSAYASLMALASLARNRGGFYRRSAGFKKGVFTHLVYFNTQKPVRHIYLQLAAATGAGAHDDGRIGPVRVRAEDEAGLLARFPVLAAPGEGWIVVNPNASDLLLERRWPAGRFAAVISQWVAQGRSVALIGSAGEAGYVAELLGQIPAQGPGRVLDTSGRLSFGELAALMGRAACVVTNDTGPMHLALALERSTVCLFGPVNPVHYGFERPNVRVLHHAIYCSPCVHETTRPPCEGNNVCMRLIEPGEVLEAVESLLRAPPAGMPGAVSAAASPGVTHEPGTDHPLGLVVSKRLRG